VEHESIVNIKKSTLFPSSKFEKVQDEFGEVTDPIMTSAGNYDVIIIGGGISGLTAAWKLKDKSILLLEKSNQFGGNARLETREGLRFASAGSCLQMPKSGSETAELLSDLDIYGKWQVTDKDTLVMFDTVRLAKCLGEVVMGLVKNPLGLLDPAVYGLTGGLFYNLLTGKKYLAAAKRLGDPVFSSLFSYLNQFTHEKGKFPAIPWNENCGWTREEMELFDSISLYDLLFESDVRKKLPSKLVPKGTFGDLVKDGIATTLRVECSYIEDVSAYVGLHFLIGYLYNPLITFPGGNGFISECIRERLEILDNYTLKNNTFVNLVQNEDNEYLVNFEQKGKNFSATAKSIIWAAPKFVALDVIDNIPVRQRLSMKEISHHDYCIANVFVKKPIMKKYFGGYVLEENILGKYRNGWCRTGACLSANWKDTEYKNNLGVLTLLKPVAGIKDQGKLGEINFNELQISTLVEITDLLKTQGYSSDMIDDIKIWRWQRGLVICKIGQLKNDIFVNSSQPIGNIFFANQDSVGIGNLESGILAGFNAADLVDNVLESKVRIQPNNIELEDNNLEFESEFN